MKRKYIVALSALTLCGSLSAQDIYKVEALSSNDLSGTARYVGMGGAMSALGADLSAMSTNPAAIGLYRRSDVAFTGSATIQPNGEQMADINRARGSFDQAGFVYAARINGDKLRFFNFGFNYQKRRNLKSYIGLENIALRDGMSQSWQMMDMAYYDGAWLDLSPDSPDCDYANPFTIVGYDAQMISPEYDANNKLTGYTPSYANRYNYHRAQWGGVQEYDFNLSFNWRDRVYGGVTFGVYNVEMHSRTEYSEELMDNTGATAMYNMYHGEELSGTGFDAKFGVIFRPIEQSPFRIGISVSTPIFFDLTQAAYLNMNSPYGYTDNNGTHYDRTEADVETGDFNYRVRTPWRVNVSMATTVGNYLALGAEYEVSKTTGAQVRYPDYDYDNYYGPISSSTKDEALAEEIDLCFKPVHTLRLGAEARLIPGVYGRLGYNYVSAPMKDDAFLNLYTDSPSYRYNTNTDYVNPGAINRITAGLGVRGKHFYADVAYQYQAQQGTTYAFHLADTDGVTNRLEGQKVDLNRHNVMFTVGYKF